MYRIPHLQIHKKTFGIMVSHDSLCFSATLSMTLAACDLALPAASGKVMPQFGIALSWFSSLGYFGFMVVK